MADVTRVEVASAGAEEGLVERISSVVRMGYHCKTHPPDEPAERRPELAN